jgi:hypothetical protein
MNGLKYHYEINGIDYLLKESFTQDELNELNFITRSLKASITTTSQDQIEGSLIKQEANRFLELTLISNQDVPKDFFDSVGELLFIEIFKDFLLKIIREQI